MTTTSQVVTTVMAQIPDPSANVHGSEASNFHGDVSVEPRQVFTGQASNRPIMLPGVSATAGIPRSAVDIFAHRLQRSCSVSRLRSLSRTKHGKSNVRSSSVNSDGELEPPSAFERPVASASRDGAVTSAPGVQVLSDARDAGPGLPRKRLPTPLPQLPLDAGEAEFRSQTPPPQVPLDAGEAEARPSRRRPLTPRACVASTVGDAGPDVLIVDRYPLWLSQISPP